MRDFSKNEQVRKVKQTNPKRMTPTQIRSFHDAIREIADKKCQLCGNQGQDMHHPEYGCRGADKNDYCQLLVCRYCHEKCHKDKHGVLNTGAKRIGHNNYREHRC